MTKRKFDTYFQLMLWLGVWSAFFLTLLIAIFVFLVSPYEPSLLNILFSVGIAMFMGLMHGSISGMGARLVVSALGRVVFQLSSHRRLLYFQVLSTVAVFLSTLIISSVFVAFTDDGIEIDNGWKISYIVLFSIAMIFVHTHSFPYFLQASRKRKANPKSQPE